MYIFGGRTEEGTDLGDLAAFRIWQRRWFTFQNMGPLPSPRSGHSMTTDGSKIYVLGGEPILANKERDGDELSRMFTLDTSKLRFPDAIDAVEEEQADLSQSLSQERPAPRPAPPERPRRRNAMDLLKGSASMSGRRTPKES